MALGNARGVSHTQTNISLNEDDLYIAFGAAETTDAYISFNGTNLIFYDSTVGATKTLTQLAASSAQTLDNVFDNGKVIDGATSEANAFQVGGANDKLTIWEEGSNDLRISTTAAANVTLAAAGGTFSFSDDAIVTTGKVTADGGLEVGADNINLTLGASDATDSKIYFDGAGNLTFYDSTAGTVTLSSMAGSNLNNPTIIGDVTVSDGKFTWTDTSDEQVLSMTSSSTTNDVMQINCATLTTGSALRIDLTEGTLNGGYYLECWDDTGGAAVMTVAENGVTTVSGGAGADAIVITAGDLQITAGDIDIDLGIITVDNTADEGNKIARNNATGTNAVLEIEQTHATGGIAFLVDQNATGDVNAVEIENAGTGYAITTTAGAAGGEGYEYIAATSGTGVGFRGDGTTGSWIGADNVGFIDIDTDGALAAGANLLRLDATGASEANSIVCEILSSGNLAGATDGALLTIAETGAAQATSYAVNISSTNNEALHVDAGLSLFDERVTITLADNTGPALAITNPDTTGNTNAVTVTPSGSGAGIAVSPQEADTQGILITTVQASTVPLLDLDLTTGTGWVGAATTGAIDVTADGAIAADGTLLRLASSGQPAGANDGVCLEIVESGAAQATSYAMRIASTNNEALHVDAGTVVVDETLQASGGILTVYSENDVTDPPTQAEMDTAFGAGAEALNGMLGVINDANGGANVWLCVCADGAWYYAAKLTIGA